MIVSLRVNQNGQSAAKNKRKEMIIMKFIKSFIKKEKVKKSEIKEVKTDEKDQPINNIPGCRFPTDPIEEDFYISQVLGI